MPFSFNLLETASAKGWYRNEGDNLKAGCVSTDYVRSRLPQDIATTDLNSALDLSFLILLCGLAWNSSDNPLVFLQSLGKVPSYTLLSLIHSSHNAQPSVVKSCRRSSTHFRTSKPYTLHAGPHVVAPPCLTLTSNSSKTLKTEPTDTVNTKRKEH